MQSSGSAQPGERGSALLIVFVMAAIVAIMLYREMPVAAFEAKRAKEQLLVDRGNEYIRGVQLFVRATKQYPPNMEALENTNRIRFLRRRYKDPFTGKDDWRLLHAGPNGVIIDSKIHPQNVAGTANNPASNPLGANNGLGNTGLGSFGAANAISGASQSSFGGYNSPPANAAAAPGSSPAVTSQAANATVNAGFSGFFAPAAPAGATVGANGESLVPQVRQRAPAVAANGAAVPPQPGAAAADGLAAQTDPTTVNSGALDQTQQLSATNGQAGTGSAGANAAPNGAGGGQSSGFGQSGFGQSGFGQRGAGQPGFGQSASGQSGFGQSGFGTNVNTGTGSQAGFGNSGLGTNQNSGSTGLGSTSSTQNTLQNPGLAGVASKAVGHSIKGVNDQYNYSLWEFFYDPTKDSARALNAPQGAGAQTNNTNTQAGFGGFNSPAGAAGTTPGGNTSSPGFGNNTNSGFGGFNSGANGANGFNNGSTNVANPVPFSPQQGLTSPPQPNPPQ